MPPKTSVNRIRDAPQKRRKTQRPEKHTDSDEDELPPSQRNLNIRQSLVLPASHNYLGQLFRAGAGTGAATSTGGNTSGPVKTPERRPRGKAKLKNKSEISPLDPSSTPASRLDKVVANLTTGSALRSSRIHFEDIEETTEGTNSDSTPETKTITSNRQNGPGLLSNRLPNHAIPTSIFSPDTSGLTGGLNSSDSNEASPIQKSTHATKRNRTSAVKKRNQKILDDEDDDDIEDNLPVSTTTKLSKRINTLSSSNDQRRKRQKQPAKALTEFSDDGNDYTSNRNAQKNKSRSKRLLQPLPEHDPYSQDSPDTSIDFVEPRHPDIKSTKSLKILRSLDSVLVSKPRSRERTTRVKARSQSEAATEYTSRGSSQSSGQRRKNSKSVRAKQGAVAHESHTSSISEPEKFQRLLVSKIQKKLNEEHIEKDPHKREILGVSKLIESQILKGLLEGSISIDWQGNQNIQVEITKEKKPDELDATNTISRETCHLMSERLQSLKKEESIWTSTFQKTIKPIEKLSIGANKVTEGDLRAYLRQKNGDAILIDEVVDKGLEKNLHSSLKETQKCMEEALVENTDRLLNLLHKLKQSLSLSSKFERDKLTPTVSEIARNFANNSVSVPSSRNVSVRDLLRGISRIDAASEVH